MCTSCRSQSDRLQEDAARNRFVSAFLLARIVPCGPLQLSSAKVNSNDLYSSPSFPKDIDSLRTELKIKVPLFWLQFKWCAPSAPCHMHCRARVSTVACAWKQPCHTAAVTEHFSIDFASSPCTHGKCGSCCRLYAADFATFVTIALQLVTKFDKAMNDNEWFKVLIGRSGSDEEHGVRQRRIANGFHGSWLRIYQNDPAVLHVFQEALSIEERDIKADLLIADVGVCIHDYLIDPPETLAMCASSIPVVPSSHLCCETYW